VRSNTSCGPTDARATTSQVATQGAESAVYDCLVMTALGQLSLASPGSLNRVPASAGLRAGMSPLRTAIHLLLTYLLFSVAWWCNGQRVGVARLRVPAVQAFT